MDFGRGRRNGEGRVVLIIKAHRTTFSSVSRRHRIKFSVPGSKTNHRAITHIERLLAMTPVVTMSFPNRFLDELRNRTSLVDLIGRKVNLHRRGKEYLGLCPFHKENTPSFTVNDDESKAFYHCFGCGAHGDAISFVMETENFTFPETVERLAGDAGMEVPRATPEEVQREKRRGALLEAVEAATKWFQQRLQEPEGKIALDYTNRGLDSETVAKFRLGYAPPLRRHEPSRLTADLKKQGFENATLLEAGLLSAPDDGRAPYDFFRNRVIFPIADRRDRVIAFGGRVLGDGEPKYLNSRDAPLFDKRRTLFNHTKNAGSAPRREGSYRRRRLYGRDRAGAGGFPCGRAAWHCDHRRTYRD